jgi:4a-hydroxytetrahydrobiopterin dehydratase
MTKQPMSNDAVNAALGNLPGWIYHNDSLSKTFKFKNFREAVSFIVRVGFSAEELNHHPELFNVYNRVDITLRTHEAGNKVTQLDIELAQAIEGFAWV